MLFGIRLTRGGHLCVQRRVPTCVQYVRVCSAAMNSVSLEERWSESVTQLSVLPGKHAIA